MILGNVCRECDCENSGGTEMRTLIVAAAVATMGITGIAIADEAKGPVVMTDAQMDNITAGVGANNVAGLPQPWGALAAAGFSPHHLPSADSGAAKADALGGVAVPSAVPHSVPFG
jgi:hypothetical protein